MTEMANDPESTSDRAISICERETDTMFDVYVGEERIGVCRSAVGKRPAISAPAVLMSWGELFAEDFGGNVYLWHVLDSYVPYICDFAAADALRAMRNGQYKAEMQSRQAARAK